MGVASKFINGALVYYDENVTHRIVDAIGPNVVKYVLNAGVDVSESNGQFVITLIEAGGGDTTIVAAQTIGDKLLITTDGTEYDGINLQLAGELFKLEAGKPFYFGVEATSNDATQSDMLIGMCELQTALLATAAAHAVGVAIEGFFFLKLDGVTTINAEVYATDVETGQAAVATAMNTSKHWYEWVWDGTTLYAYYDNVLVGSFTSGLPDAELTPSINYRTGEGNATTLRIHEMRVFEFR